MGFRCRPCCRLRALKPRAKLRLLVGRLVAVECDACQKVCPTAFATRRIAPMLHKHAAARRGGPATTSVAASAIFKISIVFSFENAVQFEPLKAREAGL